MKGYGVLPYKMVLAACLIVGVGCATSGDTKKKEMTRTEKARLFVEIANGAVVEGDPTGALQSLERAEKEDSSLPELHHTKALAFYAKHDLDSAIRSARTAVELKPDYPDANNTLGKLLMDAGKYDDAMAPLLAAAKNPLYRESYKSWTNLGILKYRRNDLLNAEAYMDKAVQDAPLRACIAYYYRGNIKLKENRLNEAIRDYDQATKRFCAKFGDAHLALGMAYQKNRQYNLARKTFVEIQKLYPNTKLADEALDQLKFLP